MLVNIPYDTELISLRVPDDTTVYRTTYGDPEPDPRPLIRESIRNPIGSPPLVEKIEKSGVRSAVVVVSDITRPIPYADFLTVLLEEIEGGGIPRKAIQILIATGMHRPSTAAERLHMFGPEVCERYSIIDHRAEQRDDLVTLSGTSHAGRPIELSRPFMEADFRIVTGLVEPHFMAGFSGGRKAVCPGLCSLETVKAFHSFAFLDDPRARNANLAGNPLHDEALSIARQVDIGFSINVIVDRNHRITDAVSGDLEAAHEIACDRVRRHACPPVEQEADIVLTSSGGYPLDATFYQCVKGMCTSLPAVRRGGVVVSLGSCSEGIGGAEYEKLLRAYSGRWQEFLADSKSRDTTLKDQWEFQMQTKVLQHVGDGHLIFVTDGLPASDLDQMNVHGIHVSKEELEQRIQSLIDGYLEEGRMLAVIPEGPYCAPIARNQGTHS